MIQSKRAVLQGQIAHLRFLDAEAASDEHRLFRRHRASRIVMLEEEIAALTAAPAEAPASSNSLPPIRMS